MLLLRFESNGLVQASMDQVFAHIDDHARLSAHMSEMVDDAVEHFETRPGAHLST